MPTTAKITEAQFTTMVLQLAFLRGWRSIHLRPARTAKGWRTAVQGDGKGFPDILAVRGSRLLIAELKVGKGKTTPEQNVWLSAWRAVPGALVFVWRPEDWEEIEQVLEHGVARHDPRRTRAQATG